MRHAANPLWLRAGHRPRKRRRAVRQLNVRTPNLRFGVCGEIAQSCRTDFLCAAVAMSGSHLSKDFFELMCAPRRTKETSRQSQPSTHCR
eukprot:6214814-Pleurochrysis_carterae.AAC.1